MKSENIDPSELKKIFLQRVPFIDVRAPVEFQAGHLPGAVNLPILNNEERALIGTTYKREGREAAIRLGYQLISGPVKDERVAAWESFLRQHPDAILYCFRGGQRSQITQQWLQEKGWSRPLLIGGYKKARQFLIDEIEGFSRSRKMLVLSGPTGSGKTVFLRQAQDFYPTVDLELLASHRGSAFGAMDKRQPTQIDFENQMAVRLLEIEDNCSVSVRPLVEDESRLIGKVCQPASFFKCLRDSEVIWLEEPLEVRVENIFKDYILDTALGECISQIPRCADELDILRTQAMSVFAKFKVSLQMISTRLGGLRYKEILQDLESAEEEFIQHNSLAKNRLWIEKTLLYYYDPLYLGSLDRRQVKVTFRGASKEAMEFLQSLPR